MDLPYPVNIAEEPGYRERMQVKEMDPLKAYDAASSYASGKVAQELFKAFPLPSHHNLMVDLADRAREMRQALDRGERVILTAGEQQLAIFEPHPGAVLAACLRREFAAQGRVTEDMVDAARSFLPNVDREAMRLAIEGALTQEQKR